MENPDDYVSSMIPRTGILAVAAIAFAVAVPQARAQDALATYDSWNAMAAGKGKDRVCYVAAAPQREVGKYSRRGDTFVLVTQRPGEGTRDTVEVRAGYTYKSDSDVTINIDGRKYSLFTNSDSAWARDSKTDHAIAEAMKAGKEMIVTGYSERGTLTTDTYSLSGFTAAYNASVKACGLK